MKEAGTPERFEEWRARHGLFRKAEDALGEEWIDEYLAWSCAKGNVQTYFWLIENCTIVEVAIAFAMSRTDEYLK